jgi:hypothetical protein
VQRNDPTTGARQFRIVLRQDPDSREALHGLSVVLNNWGTGREAHPLKNRQSNGVTCQVCFRS